MKVYILGNACMAPTPKRNAFGVLINFEGENILVDAGEGVQQQLMRIKFYPSNIDKILITHLHGDHLWGLFGLLQSIKASGVRKKIDIYGPNGFKKVLREVLGRFINLDFINFNEVRKPIVFEEKKYFVKAKKLKHSTACLGYSFIEKDRRKINLDYVKKFGLVKHPLLGKLQKGEDIVYKGKKISVEKGTKLVKGRKISFVMDTLFNKNCVELAKGADLLICESTFLEEDKDKAREYKHLTAKQAAMISKKGNVGKLVLTHFSQRYKDDKVFEKEARKVFKNSFIAKELEPISL